MMEVLSWAGEHWFLAWMAIWGVSWLGISATSAVLRLIGELLIMTIKCIPIIFRGWPPEHIDYWDD